MITVTVIQVALGWLCLFVLLDMILLTFEPILLVSGEGKQLPWTWRQCGSAVLASHQPWSLRHRIWRQDHPHLGRPDHQMHGHSQHERWSSKPVIFCYREIYLSVGYWLTSFRGEYQHMLESWWSDHCCRQQGRCCDVHRCQDAPSTCWGAVQVWGQWDLLE